MTQSNKPKPLALKASNDLASKGASKGIRLHKDQSTVHGFLFGCGPTAKYLTGRCERFATVGPEGSISKNGQMRARGAK
jgi:hypothetical protein